MSVALLPRLLNKPLLLSVFFFSVLGGFSRFFIFQIDLTKDKRYTLSEETLNQIQKIKNPLKIDVFLSGDIPSKYLKIINDSKSTTLSSTVPFLESNERILWILGGLFKKGDKFNLNKKYFKNLEAYIYGKDRQVFLKLFKNKIKVNLSKDLRNTLKLIPKLKDIRTKVTVLFSPSAASFDQYKNFEERGRQFNMLIKRYLPIE